MARRAMQGIVATHRMPIIDFLLSSFCDMLGFASSLHTHFLCISTEHIEAETKWPLFSRRHYWRIYAQVLSWVCPLHLWKLWVNVTLNSIWRKNRHQNLNQNCFQKQSIGNCRLQIRMQYCWCLNVLNTKANISAGAYFVRYTLYWISVLTAKIPLGGSQSCPNSL